MSIFPLKWPFTFDIRTYLPQTRTCCRDEAHKEQDDHTPDDFDVHPAFKLGAFVPCATIVQHGFCFTSCEMVHTSKRAFYLIKKVLQRQKLETALTCVNNNAFNIICISKSTVSQQKIVFGEGHAFAWGQRDGTCEVVDLGRGSPNLHHVVKLRYLKPFILKSNGVLKSTIETW